MAKGAHRPAPHGTHCGAEGLLFTSAVFAGHCAAAGRQTTLATTSHSNTGNCLLGVPVIICGSRVGRAPVLYHSSTKVMMVLLFSRQSQQISLPRSPK